MTPSATPSVPPRRRPSYVFWDRTRKSSGSSAHNTTAVEPAPVKALHDDDAQQAAQDPAFGDMHKVASATATSGPSDGLGNVEGGANGGNQDFDEELDWKERRELAMQVAVGLTAPQAAGSGNGDEGDGDFGLPRPSFDSFTFPSFGSSPPASLQNDVGAGQEGSAQLVTADARAHPQLQHVFGVPRLFTVPPSPENPSSARAHRDPRTSRQSVLNPSGRDRSGSLGHIDELRSRGGRYERPHDGRQNSHAPGMSVDGGRPISPSAASVSETETFIHELRQAKRPHQGIVGADEAGMSFSADEGDEYTDDDGEYDISYASQTEVDVAQGKDTRAWTRYMTDEDEDATRYDSTSRSTHPSGLTPTPADPHAAVTPTPVQPSPQANRSRSGSSSSSLGRSGQQHGARQAPANDEGTSPSGSVVGDSSGAGSVGGSNHKGRSREGSSVSGAGGSGGSGAGGGRSRSGSSASLLREIGVPKSQASFVIAVVGHRHVGKSTVIRKGLRQFGLSRPVVLSDRVTSHSTVCVVDSEQRTIEVLEIEASVLLSGPGKRFAWPKFLPRIDAVILCYDAGNIASFRGMSDLLEEFAMASLTTVMLACKSEIVPKAVDPYYASDMAFVYKVGLAECTVESEEGKRRMRDCFSYLVKEVAKSRKGMEKKDHTNTASSPTTGSASGDVGLKRAGGKSLKSESSLDSLASQLSSAPSSSLPVLPRSDSLPRTAVSSAPPTLANAPGESQQGQRATTSPAAAAGVPGVPASASDETVSEDPSAARGAQPKKHTDAGSSLAASAYSETSSSVHYGAELGEDPALKEVMEKTRRGILESRASGGYVTLEELWDKFFFAGVSNNDERFVHTFLVFYRAFTRPIELLKQIAIRFEDLAGRDEGPGSAIVRFAMMRLVNLLGDWLEQYPGDFSHPRTYALLRQFYDALSRHHYTIYVATPLLSLIQVAEGVPDLDGPWAVSAEDEAQVDGVEGGKSAPAQNAPFKSMGSVDTPASIKSGSTGGGANSSSNPPAISMTNADPGSEQSRAASRTTSHGSSSSGHLNKPGGDLSAAHGRARSASDVTNATGEGAANRALSFFVGSGSYLSQSTGVEVALRGIHSKISDALASVPEEAIVTQLNRIEWELFMAISPRDLLRHVLVPRDKRAQNGPVARSIAHFNYVSSWVCTIILAQSKTKSRARMLEKFMHIAQLLRVENNYNTLMAVLAGLSSASIHRLKATRELIQGKPVNKVYQSLCRLMHPDRSFAAYRLALSNSEGRTVPYLGVHLQDVLSISDGNKSVRLSDGNIHWRKFSLMDEAVMAIVQCQTYSKTPRRDQSIERLIMDVPVMDEETLYEHSLAVEPRQSANTTPSNKLKKLMGGN